MGGCFSYFSLDSAFIFFTARDLTQVMQDMGTSQHRMACHDQRCLDCAGWRLYVQSTAIAPYHPIRVARLDG